MSTPPVPPLSVLRHARFVQALARSLLGDGDAEDVAQDTWVAALEHPPRRAATARAWLARVLVNKVRERHRRRRRRAARERAHARSPRIASTADVLARREILDRVAEAVFTLEEPYRSTVLHRYYDGLPPREIARAMGCPVETVKSRLQRAHARLRSTLDARGPDWRAALLPVVGGASGPVGSGAVPWIVGADVVSKKILVVAVLAVVALLGYVAWRAVVAPSADPDGAPGIVARDEPPLPSSGERGPTLRGAEDAHDDAVAGDLPGRREATPRAPGSASTPEAPGPDAPAGDPPGPATITGMVTVGAWPAREGRVRVLLRGGTRLEAVLDADGRFEIVAPLSGSLTLSVSVPGRQPRTVQLHASPGANEPVEVAFGEGRIFGVVRDAQGSPLAGASVRLSTYLVEGDEGYVPSAEGDVFGMSVRAGDDGGYAFTDLPAGRYVLVATTAPEGQDARNMRSFRVELAAGERRRLDIGAVRYDPTWTGTVRYGDGRAVARAGSLFLQEEDGERRLYVSFDAEGRFAQEVPPGTYRLEIVFPGARLGWGMQLVQTAQTVTVLPSGTVEDVVLPGVRVTGRVRIAPHPPESPARPTYVVFTLESADGERPPSLIAREPTRRVRAALAADGTFAVDGLPPGVWRVTGEPVPLVDEDGGPTRVAVAEGGRDVELVLVPAAPGPDAAGAPR